MTRNDAHKTSWGKTAFVLLSLLMMGNASHGMVVCIGAHGHVAIEPTGHDHCADARDAHHCDPATPGSSASGHLSDNHCEPCVDIPLSLGAFDDRLTSGVAKMSGSTPTACIEPPATSPTDRANPLTSTIRTFLTFHTPLSNIVLQV